MNESSSILCSRQEMRNLFFLLSFVVVTLNAQTFTERLQKKVVGQGSVDIFQEKTIEDLVNGKAKNVFQSVSSAKITAATTSQKAVKENTSGNISLGDDASISLKNKTYRKSYSITGYRIQLYAGDDSRVARQKANFVGVKVKESFPTLPVYTHFYSPRWICRVGDFRTYEEASSYLRQIRKLGDFKEASIVKCKIQVGY